MKCSTIQTLVDQHRVPQRVRVVPPVRHAPVVPPIPGQQQWLGRQHHVQQGDGFETCRINASTPRAIPGRKLHRLPLRRHQRRWYPMYLHLLIQRRQMLILVQWSLPRFLQRLHLLKLSLQHCWIDGRIIDQTAAVVTAVKRAREKGSSELQ